MSDYSQWDSYEPVKRRNHPLASMCWGASHAVGLLAGGVVTVGLVVAAVAGRGRLADIFASLVPHSVKTLLDRPVTIDPPKIHENVKGRVARAAPEPASRREAEAVFMLGSSEETVIRCQGRPGRIAGSTWFYGDSEVHFLVGRVVGWKESPKNPLKVR